MTGIVQMVLVTLIEKLARFTKGSAGVAQIWMQILFKVAQFWMPFNNRGFRLQSPASALHVAKQIGDKQIALNIYSGLNRVIDLHNHKNKFKYYYSIIFSSTRLHLYFGHNTYWLLDS